MRVEALAQVHLDVERLLAGDEPAAAHEHRRDEAEDDDRPDVEPELMRVVVRQRLVDDVLPRHEDEGDLARLRADREEDRDHEAALVRAEERKKPRERAAVGNRAHSFECSDGVRSSRALRAPRGRGRSRAPAARGSPGSLSQPLAPDGWGSGTTGVPSQLVPLADARRERREAEQPPQREPADRDDQARPQQLELPVAPERAELLLARRRRPVAAARRGAAGIAARDGGAVEGRVELVLVELEPAAERPAGAPAPRQPLLSLDDARRLAEQVRALFGARRPHGQRLERIARLDAGAAAGEVALERGERAVGRLAGGHRRGA